MNSAFPFVVFETTPPPADPASSPVLVLKFEPSIITGFPSIVTFLLPLSVSDDMAMLGYGMGIGPAGDGVLQTSGKAMATPSLDLCTTVRSFTFTVAGMSGFYCLAAIACRSVMAKRWPSSLAVQSSASAAGL